jgi:hypothetical protein
VEYVVPEPEYNKDVSGVWSAAFNVANVFTEPEFA